jgi:hypothetical protein
MKKRDFESSGERAPGLDEKASAKKVRERTPESAEHAEFRDVLGRLQAFEYSRRADKAGYGGFVQSGPWEQSDFLPNLVRDVKEAAHAGDEPIILFLAQNESAVLRGAYERGVDGTLRSEGVSYGAWTSSAEGEVASDVLANAFLNDIYRADPEWDGFKEKFGAAEKGDTWMRGLEAFDDPEFLQKSEVQNLLIRLLDSLEDGIGTNFNVAGPKTKKEFGYLASILPVLEVLRGADSLVIQKMSEGERSIGHSGLHVNIDFTHTKALEEEEPQTALGKLLLQSLSTPGGLRTLKERIDSLQGTEAAHGSIRDKLLAIAPNSSKMRRYEQATEEKAELRKLRGVMSEMHRTYENLVEKLEQRQQAKKKSGLLGRFGFGTSITIEKPQEQGEDKIGLQRRIEELKAIITRMEKQL